MKILDLKRIKADIFVYQKTTVKAHPVRKDLIGTDLYNAKDENGIFYVRELYQRALDKKKGGGLLPFTLQNLNPMEKIQLQKKQHIAI